MSRCVVRDLGSIGYSDASELQRRLVEQRKKGEIPNQLLFVTHPHVITLGRNSHLHNVRASPEVLHSAGVTIEETNRGGDVTYHGPGQIVAYPVLDLKDWKRDVVAYVRAMEQAIIDAVAEWGVSATRIPGMTGVWVDGAKVAAIGVHISRWVTCHGFALNVSTDLTYFQHIVPCGLTMPVTSLRALGYSCPEADLKVSLARELAKQFDLQLDFSPAPIAAITASAIAEETADNRELVLSTEGKQ